jgi:hypothetical protein
MGVVCVFLGLYTEFVAITAIRERVPLLSKEHSKEQKHQNIFWRLGLDCLLR